jgi:hypothetical protein
MCSRLALSRRCVLWTPRHGDRAPWLQQRSDCAPSSFFCRVSQANRLLFKSITMRDVSTSLDMTMDTLANHLVNARQGHGKSRRQITRAFERSTCVPLAFEEDNRAGSLLYAPATSSSSVISTEVEKSLTVDHARHSAAATAAFQIPPQSK